MVNSYLQAEVRAHTTQVQLKSSDMDHFKWIVRSALRTVSKFTSKDSNDKLSRDFEPILVGGDCKAERLPPTDSTETCGGTRWASSTFPFANLREG